MNNLYWLLIVLIAFGAVVLGALWALSVVGRRGSAPATGPVVDVGQGTSRTTWPDVVQTITENTTKNHGIKPPPTAPKPRIDPGLYYAYPNGNTAELARLLRWTYSNTNVAEWVSRALDGDIDARDLEAMEAVCHVAMRRSLRKANGAGSSLRRKAVPQLNEESVPL